MSKLHELRSQLAALARRRQQLRWGIGWSALAITVLWVLAVVFFIDLMFEREMHAPQRAVVFLLSAAATVWAYFRFTKPHLQPQESAVEMALLVEGQQKIDSDLVAAIEFEEPEAKSWGSQQLQQEVIDYVAKLGRGIDVFRGIDYAELKRRGTVLGVSVLIGVLAIALFPLHMGTFAGRLALLAWHYPKDTKIEDVRINGQSIALNTRGDTVVRVGYGTAVDFEVICSGDLPEKGEVELKSDEHGKKNPVDLVDRGEVDPAERGTAGGNSVVAVRYCGTVPRLLDSVKYEVQIGDNWTDRRHIQVIPLPVLQPKISVLPPAYARDAEALHGAAEGETGSLQLAVIESSQVRLAFEASKELENVQVAVGSDENERTFDLRCIDEQNHRWALMEEDTPFTLVSEPVRFEVRAVDTDGLSPESPIRGYIRLKADQPPHISGRLVHRVVLPTASPVIEYFVRDDYGISRLDLHIDIERQRNDTAAAPEDDRKTVSLASLDEPITRSELPLNRRFALNLADFALKKGDRLRLTLEVTDFRGKLAGRSSLSEPLLLDISDESGVLAAISEADIRSEQWLTDLINRQMGVGKAPLESIAPETDSTTSEKRDDG